MKKIYTLVLSIFAIIAFSQVPQYINYQGIARDVNGNAVLGQAITLDFGIYNQLSGGALLYSETVNKTTDAITGIFTHGIGGGSPTFSVFSSLDWSSGQKFLEVKYNGVALGRQQMLSVPYALYAEKSGSAGSPSLSVNAPHTSSGSGSNNLSLSIANPTLNIGGIATSTSTTGYNLDINVPAPILNYTAGTNVLSLTQGIAVTTVNLSGVGANTINMMGTGNASVNPNIGNSFTVSVPPQVLSNNANTINLSNGGGSVVMPMTAITASTGIAVSGSSLSGYVISCTLAPAPYIAGQNINIAGNVISSPTYSLNFTTPLNGNITNGPSTTPFTIPSPTLTAGSNIIITGAWPTQTVAVSNTLISGAWTTTGNIGTNTVSNFIGTTDPVDLVFKTGNVSRAFLSSGGNFGIGSTSPLENLQVESLGNSKISIISPGGNIGALWFGKTVTHNAGIIQYNNSTDEMNFGTASALSRLKLFGNGTAAFGSTLAANPAGAFVNFCKQGANDTKVLISGGDNNNNWGGMLSLGENENSLQGMTMKLHTGANKLVFTNDVNGSNPVVSIGGYSGASNGMMIGTGYWAVNSPPDGLAVQGNVGIGTSAPTNLLHVNGAVRISDGSQGLNKVLTSDAAGVATWKQMAVGFKVEAIALQNIPFASYAIVGFDNSIFDDATAFNLGTETYVVPSTGLYSFSGTVYWSSYVASRPTLQILVNGSLVQNSFDYCAPGSQLIQQITTSVKVNAGDLITLRVYNDGATPTNISGVSGLQGTTFSGFKIY